MNRVAMRSVCWLALWGGCTSDVPQLPIPDGVPPNFSVGERFISIDQVKEEFDRGAGFYFLDARPSVDYALRHIEGAIEMPFYEVEERAPILPQGTWYIAYCSCPHSESGIVMDFLLEEGYETVAILDEGYLEWEARDYPTEPGEQ